MSRRPSSLRVLSSLSSIALMVTFNSLHGPALAAPDASPRLDPPSAGAISLALDRLGVVGTVLYVAAHPDDENTRFLAWLANARGIRAAYVSLTRGDGGQNLVGPELGPLLGLIRTHELLAARKVDGAEQYFTRAVDFGYSKSAEETLAIWGKDAVLGDLVRVVRTTRPDVIVTRFSIDPPNHGHHTASALLAREAFVAAADPARFPEQLAPGPDARTPALAPHRAARLFENKSPWRFKEGEDLSRYLSVDVGGLSPELGRSYTELAADSRTMHKSQGFGTAPQYGAQLEYFEATTPQAWPVPPDTKAKDPLAGLDFTWARYPKTEALRKALAAAKKAFDPARPEALLPHLYKVHAALAALPDDNPWKATKRAELEALMLACAGLWLDARAAGPVAIPGEPLALTASAVARLTADAKVAVTWPDGTTSDAKALALNALDKREAKVVVPTTAAYSTPYWLVAPHPDGLFAPAPPETGIAPVAAPDLAVRFAVALGPVAFEVVRPVRHAWVDQVHGERFRPVEVLPPVTLTPAASHRMFPDAAARPIEVHVKAHGAARAGQVALTAPAGWKVTPASQPYALAAEGEATVVFDVTPSGTAPVDLRLTATLGDASSSKAATLDRAEAVIDHLHVPRTTILSPAVVRAVPVDLEITAAPDPKTGAKGAKAAAAAAKPASVRIAYLSGAGDEVAASLAQVGYDVTVIDPKQLERIDLAPFAAVVAGIRSYNVDGPALVHAHAALMRYVEAGGTYLVQYQTSNRQRPLGDVPIGPAPFTIDQGRVTEEDAELRALDPKHPALVTPNVLGPDDYRGWVQERGLYFAATWDPAYTPVFSANDKGEKPLEGALIVARHGKGAFVYTGLAFFRQLPEGVPGAYRLFANLLALKGATSGAAK